MAYEMITRIRSRRGEKVAPFATVENAVGMALLGGPFFVLGELSLFVRIPLVVLGVVLGYLITQDLNGMMLCERVFWRLRGEANLLLIGRTITPDDLPGTRRTHIAHRAVARGGVVRKSRRERTPAVRTVTAQGPIIRRRVEHEQISEPSHADHPA